MNEVEQWLARLACRDVVERSARCVDAGDAEGMAALFTPDGVLQRPSGAVLQGREAIRSSYAQRPANRITRHLVTGTVVELHMNGTAQAHSRVLLWSGSSDTPDTPFGREAQPRELVGEFDDLLQQQSDGAWRIVQRTASFTLYRELCGR